MDGLVVGNIVPKICCWNNDYPQIMLWPWVTTHNFHCLTQVHVAFGKSWVINIIHNFFHLPMAFDLW